MAAQDDLDKAQAAVERGVASYTYKGTRYTLGQLANELIPRLREQAKQEAAAAKKAADAKKRLEETRGVGAARKAVDEAQNAFDNAVERFNKGTLGERDVAKFRLRLQTAQETLARLTPPQPVTGRPTSTTTTPTVTPTATPTATTTTTPTVTPTAAATGVTTTTPATGKGKGKGTRQVDTGWEEVFKQQFPQYSYLLDANVFGQDMADVLRRAVTEEWFKQPDQIETLMTQAVTGTNYYRTTTTNQQAFDKLTPANRQQFIDQQLISLKDTYGNLQFNEQQLTEIATKAARDGKQGKALELFVYQQALSTVPGTTGFVAPTAASRVMTSSAADRIRNIGREYGVLPSEQEIQDVLTGVKSEDDLRQSYKLVARRWYKGVEEDIDSGLTIQQIFAPYRQYAAAILEKSPNDIDFIDQNGVPTVYSEALQGPDGPLSLSDWMRKLKADDRYGYQFTNQAKQQATNLVMEMEKAFGFRA